MPFTSKPEKELASGSKVTENGDRGTCPSSNARDALREAIAELDKAIEQTPANGSLFLQRGRLHWQAGNISACYRDYDEAQRLNPHSPASQLKKMAQDIMACHYKDLYNP